MYGAEGTGVKSSVRFGVLTALTMKLTALWFCRYILTFRSNLLLLSCFLRNVVTLPGNTAVIILFGVNCDI